MRGMTRIARLTIALAQLNPTVGDVSGNLESWSVLTNGQADGAGRFLFGPAFAPDATKNFIRAVELGTGTETPIGW